MLQMRPAMTQLATEQIVLNHSAAPFHKQLTRPTHTGLIARSLAPTTHFCGLTPGDSSLAR